MKLKGPWIVRRFWINAYFYTRETFKWISIVIGLILGGVIVVRGSIELIILFLDTVNW